MSEMPAEPVSDCIQRAMLSLEGLSCGDAFGECFFALPFDQARRLMESRTTPRGAWSFTDDTMMAISIVETLKVHGKIEELYLAEHFAELYDPFRGYGAAMHRLLMNVRGGRRWQEESASLFDGKGSFGNGSAMRVAPLGAYFADDLNLVVEQARRSAIVTHAHREAVAGAIAVAAAAAIAWRTREQDAMEWREFIGAVRALVPASQVRDGIDRALLLDAATTAPEAGMKLGNGSQITAMDTVPFVLWSAARFMGNFEEALWQTVSAFGDKDTTCAMVGGIVALRTGIEGIPAEWRQLREPLSVVMKQG